MMPTDIWKPIFALPNVQLAEGIEHECVALVPADDPRVRSLRRAHPSLGKFLGRFSDNFGVKFEPALLIMRADAPAEFFEIGAVAGFRDSIAISTVCRSRALELCYPRGHRILFSEAFAIYPWMIDKDFEHVIGVTPAILGMHDPERLKAQSSSSIFRHTLEASDLDQPLIGTLLSRWYARYRAGEPDWASIALFRSLNMAYNASLLPAASDTTFYDIGRLVSLWVSAFEILVHPGGSGQANRDKVFDLLETVPWQFQATAELTHDTGGRVKVRRTLASLLYQLLNDCRNNFLHGNPVDRDDLLLPISRRTIFEYAAPLYRLALAAFLRVAVATEMPADPNNASFGAYIADHMDFMAPQQQAEEALLTALRSPEDQRRSRARPARRRDR